MAAVEAHLRGSHRCSRSAAQPCILRDVCTHGVCGVDESPWSDLGLGRCDNEAFVRRRLSREWMGGIHWIPGRRARSSIAGGSLHPRQERQRVEARSREHHPPVSRVLTGCPSRAVSCVSRSSKLPEGLEKNTCRHREVALSQSVCRLIPRVGRRPGGPRLR